jgi:hypothetical protein
VVVLVVAVAVESDNAGPDSLGAPKASAAAPATIAPDEQIAVTIFQVIDQLHPGPRPRRTPALCTIEGLVKFTRREGLFGPLPTWRRARRVVLQFLPGAKVARRRIGLTGKQNETWLSVAEIRADHHERLKAHVAHSAGK